MLLLGTALSCPGAFSDPLMQATHCRVKPPEHPSIAGGQRQVDVDSSLLMPQEVPRRAVFRQRPGAPGGCEPQMPTASCFDQKTKIMTSGPITSWQIDGETMETVRDFILGAPKSLQMVTAAVKLKDTCSLEEKL